MTIMESYPIPSNDDILKLEEKIGQPLPHDFKVFLKKYNATIFREDRFFDVNKNMYVIQSFYPLVRHYQMSIDLVYDRLNNLFDSRYIPFADDPGGYQFILSVNSTDYGKVYLYRYDQEWSKSLILLTDNFQEFIDGLVSEKDQG